MSWHVVMVVTSDDIFIVVAIIVAGAPATHSIFLPNHENNTFGEHEGALTDG